jgi:hypothetical protein
MIAGIPCTVGAEFACSSGWSIFTVRYVGHPHMQIEPALTPGIVFSDMVIREAGSNKLSLVGCFQRFSYPQFPAQTGIWFVTVAVTGIRGAIRTLNITARIEVAESAHVISSANAQIQFQENNPPVQPEIIFEVPLPFNGVIFQNPGRYSVVILVDTEEVGRRTLEVAPITQSGAQK